MSRRQRDHAGEYARGLRARGEKNLSDKVCHGCAAASAGEKFGLEPDEREAVDACPDEKCPERTKEEEKIAYPLFELPGVRITNTNAGKRENCLGLDI